MILPQSFVRESAVARFFPGELFVLFVKEKDDLASRRQQRISQSARWTASDNGNGRLGTHAVVADLQPVEKSELHNGSHKRNARQRAARLRRCSREFTPSRGWARVPANPRALLQRGCAV